MGFGSLGWAFGLLVSFFFGLGDLSFCLFAFLKLFFRILGIRGFLGSWVSSLLPNGSLRNARRPSLYRVGRTNCFTWKRKHPRTLFDFLSSNSFLEGFFYQLAFL